MSIEPERNNFLKNESKKFTIIKYRRNIIGSYIFSPLKRLMGYSNKIYLYNKSSNDIFFMLSKINLEDWSDWKNITVILIQKHSYAVFTPEEKTYHLAVSLNKNSNTPFAANIEIREEERIEIYDKKK